MEKGRLNWAELTSWYESTVNTLNRDKSASPPLLATAPSVTQSNSLCNFLGNSIQSRTEFFIIFKTNWLNWLHRRGGATSQLLIPSLSSQMGGFSEAACLRGRDLLCCRAPNLLLLQQDLKRDNPILLHSRVNPHAQCCPCHLLIIAKGGNGKSLKNWVQTCD